MRVRIYRLDKSVPLPTQANPNDAGWDVYAAEEVAFYCGDTRLVSLGIIAEAPPGWHFELLIRSSMAWKQKFRLANSVGIIDAKFCGERDIIKMILEYRGEDYQPIKKGERIGQLILARNQNIEWEEQDSPDFAGGDSRGGFGSSGMR